MTDTYEQLKNLFEDEQTIDDLWDSEDIVWIDWREDDEDIISTDANASEILFKCIFPPKKEQISKNHYECEL